MTKNRLLKAAERTWKAFMKFGPVDDGRKEGDNFDAALLELRFATQEEARNRKAAKLAASLDIIEECPECGEEYLECEDLDPVEGGNIEQKAWCPKCGTHWMDVFVLAERHELARKDTSQLDVTSPRR